MPCAIGTFYDLSNKTCNACPQGTYQSETGQQQCSKCPNIAGRIGVTAGPGARSAADCKGNLHKWCLICVQLSNLFLFIIVLLQNVVRLENISILKAACVDHAVTVSINQMKVPSPAYCAVLDKQHVQLKLHHAKNVAMNAHPVNNWAQMAVANHAHEAHTDLKVFSQLVLVVHWDVPHQRSALRRLRSARCQCACQEPI